MATIAIDYQETLIDDLVVSAPPAWLADETAIDRLMVGVLVQAVRDAIHPTLVYQENPEQIQAEARAWLTSDEAAEWIERAGSDPATIRRWVVAGCPEPKQVKPDQEARRREKQREKEFWRNFASGKRPSAAQRKAPRFLQPAF